MENILLDRIFPQPAGQRQITRNVCQGAANSAAAMLLNHPEDGRSKGSFELQQEWIQEKLQKFGEKSSEPTLRMRLEHTLGIIITI